jgi:hypothetical protein
MKPKPHWPNHCLHKEDTFVGTFTTTKGNPIDIWMFYDPYDGPELCLRFGEEDNEYYSPGSVRQLYQSASQWLGSIYHESAKFLTAHGITDPRQPNDDWRNSIWI